MYFPFVAGYKHAKTVELPQQRSSSVATQQTTVSSVPSHPSTAGVSSIDWLYWQTIPCLRQELNLSTYQRCTALEVSSSWWCMLHHADDVNPGLRTHWAEAWYKTRWRSNRFTEVGQTLTCSWKLYINASSYSWDWVLEQIYDNGYSITSPPGLPGGNTLKLWLEPPGADTAQIHSESILFSFGVPKTHRL